MIYKQRYFYVAFALGLAVGVLVNVLSYWFRSDGPSWADGYAQFGWPFIMWREGGFVYVKWFSWGNTALNIVVWIIAAAACAWVVSRIMYARSIRGLSLCAQCHYDLRGSIGSKTCPECGAPIASSMGERRSNAM